MKEHIFSLASLASQSTALLAVQAVKKIGSLAINFAQAVYEDDTELPSHHTKGQRYDWIGQGEPEQVQVNAARCVP